MKEGVQGSLTPSDLLLMEVQAVTQHIVNVVNIDWLTQFGNNNNKLLTHTLVFI